MPTTFYLIRHAAHDLLGRTLVGRSDAVRLSEKGHRQSQQLAFRLMSVGLAAVYSSPLPRARETAEPIARKAGLDVKVAPAATEFDFGAWTGRPMDTLEGDPLWRRFNMFRSTTAAPGGELMLDVQSRIVALLRELALRHPDSAVAIVSHGDVLRAAILHCLGMPLDLFLRIEIEPASISVVEVSEWSAKLVSLNEKVAG
ncbi:MAG TPA: histidine phosphatase family protein [Alphaproteobacteria bacterium]|nr:histidine phosphatase family protein [Alphaproteobacteria bacterium]